MHGRPDIDQDQDAEDYSEAEPARSPRRLRAVLLVVVGCVLVWQVATRTLVAFLAERTPKAALAINASEPTALVNLVGRSIYDEEAAGKPSRLRLAVPDLLSIGTRLKDRGFAESSRDGPGPGEQIDKGSPKPEALELPSDDQLRHWATSALVSEPLNARALTLLGLLAERRGRDDVAESLMKVATRHSLHESAAINWLMRKAFQKSDAESLVYYADVLLRSRPDVSKFVVAKLTAGLENKTDNGDFAKNVSSHLKATLASDPPWRRRFFLLLPETISDGKTPLDLLLSVKANGLPPDIEELRGYLNLLIRNELHELAYFAWLQFLPTTQLASVGNVFNGSFESNPSGLPFDWTVLPGSGVTVDLVERADYNGRALVLQFTQGRVDFRGLTEYVFLPAGRYHFESKYMGSLSGRRGLVWRIRCAGDEGVLGEVEIATGVQPEWASFGFDFTVPATHCRAQIIQLTLNARSMSERLITGEAWFDDVSIEQVKASKSTVGASESTSARQSN